mgnify:CR=1 FL=1
MEEAFNEFSKQPIMILIDIEKDTTDVNPVIAGTLGHTHATLAFSEEACERLGGCVERDIP